MLSIGDFICDVRIDNTLCTAWSIIDWQSMACILIFWRTGNSRVKNPACAQPSYAMPVLQSLEIVQVMNFHQLVSSVQFQWVGPIVPRNDLWRDWKLSFYNDCDNLNYREMIRKPMCDCIYIKKRITPAFARLVSGLILVGVLNIHVDLHSWLRLTV
jgi:hypothetical protein